MAYWPRNLELLLDPIFCCPVELPWPGVDGFNAGGVSAKAVVSGPFAFDELMDMLAAEELMADMSAADRLIDGLLVEELLADKLAADELMEVLSLDWLMPDNPGSYGFDLFELEGIEPL